MGKISVLFLVVIGSLLTQKVLSGKCAPPPSGVSGACYNECESNADCGGGLLCCSNGCGNTCQAPGVCPAPGDFGICINECDSDSSCPGNTICCSNGCGRTCQAPEPAFRIRRRTGCPPVSVGQVGICMTECSSDADCGGSRSCCFNGCANVCY